MVIQTGIFIEQGRKRMKINKYKFPKLKAVKKPKKIKTVESKTKKGKKKK